MSCSKRYATGRWRGARLARRLRFRLRFRLHFRLRFRLHFRLRLRAVFVFVDRAAVGPAAAAHSAVSSTRSLDG